MKKHYNLKMSTALTCKEWSEYLSSEGKQTFNCSELRQTIKTNIIKNKLSIGKKDRFFGQRSIDNTFTNIFFSKVLVIPSPILKKYQQ